MSLSPGQRLGAYEIIALIGEGGMGQVYRARDPKLNRDVALKILPATVAADPDRLARMRREAQVLASLNHPNVAAIYGFEDTASTPALVLELVEGPTLADRIGAGALSVGEALAIARQVADALAVAHDAGVIHRDLKPANIKVRDDGAVKVLDFGLAKAMDSGAAQRDAPSMANSPTLTARATEMGMILGTAAYMAPEQARGKAVDRRADVWAFGVVLYEMLTGRRAFDGPEVSDVLASVLKETPPLEALPSDVPASVRRLLRRALEKDRAKRLDSMAAARLELDDAGGEADAPAVAGVPARGRSRAVALPIALAVLVTALATAAVVWRAREPEPQAVVKLAVTPTPDQPIAVETNHNDIAITPDGTRLLYFTRLGDVQGFAVRPLGEFQGTVLNKLGADARGLFMSHDGRWIGYQVGPGGQSSEIRKAPIDGGGSIRICAIEANMRGASWGADDSIVFATTGSSGLQRVSAGGGNPEKLTTPSVKDGELSHGWPQHLPDGQHVLFAIRRADETWDVAVLTLATKTWRVLVKDGTSPRFVAPGYLVFGSSGGIRAVGFDPDRLEVSGDPIEVQPDVVTKVSGATNFAVSQNGTLAFLPGVARSVAETLAWLTPVGKEIPLRVPPLEFLALDVSPDARLAIATVGRTNSGSLWLIDLTRETALRLTPQDMPALSPVWSQDSREIVFWSPGRPGSTGERGMFRLAVTGTSQPERITTAPDNVRQLPGAWLADGKTVLFDERIGQQGPADIKQVTLTSPPVVTPLIAGPAPEVGPAISPDGRWLAYTQVESRAEVFVRPFPNINDARVPVSSGLGSGPVWSLDGRELYFRRAVGEIMVVSVEQTSPIAFSAPRPFLQTRTAAGVPFFIGQPPVKGRVLKTVSPGASTAPATEYRVVLNWAEELKARVKPK